MRARPGALAVSASQGFQCQWPGMLGAGSRPRALQGLSAGPARSPTVPQTAPQPG